MSNFNKVFNERFLNVNRRMHHPRNFELSEEFVRAFEKEYAKQIAQGQDSKNLFDKICKSLIFVVNKK